MAFLAAVFFFQFNKNDIISNLYDTVPWNDIFIFFAPETAEFAGHGDYHCLNFSGSTVEFKINGAAQAFAGTGIDDLFLSEFA